MSKIIVSCSPKLNRHWPIFWNCMFIFNICSHIIELSSAQLSSHFVLLWIRTLSTEAAGSHLKLAEGSSKGSQLNHQGEPLTLWLQEEDDDNLYLSIRRLRDRTMELSSQVALLERSPSGDVGYQQSLQELRAAQDQLGELVEARNRR